MLPVKNKRAANGRRISSLESCFTEGEKMAELLKKIHVWVSLFLGDLD